MAPHYNTKKKDTQKDHHTHRRMTFRIKTLGITALCISLTVSIMTIIEQH